MKYCMKDEYGEVWIHLLPFLKPAVVRHVFPEEEITSYQDAVSCAVKHMQIDPTKRNVLLAHQFVTGAARCDSEEVSVGGVDQIAERHFRSLTIQHWDISTVRRILKMEKCDIAEHH